MRGKRRWKGEKKSIREEKKDDSQLIKTGLPIINCSFSHDGKYLAVVTNNEKRTLVLYFNDESDQFQDI